MRGAFGHPGGYLSANNRFAQLLARQSSANNGTHAGGLASAIDETLMGYLLAKDQKDFTSANDAAMKGMSAQQWTPPEGEVIHDRPSTEPGAQVIPREQAAANAAPAGGYAGGLSALEDMGDNPYAGRLSQRLAMGQMEQQAAAERMQQQFANAQKLRMSPSYQAPPASVQEYEFAKKNGFTGSFEDWKASGGGQEKFGNSPIWGTDAQGNPVLMQPSNRGGVRQVEMPEGVTPQRGQTSRVDLGDRFGLLDANGTLIGYIPKGLAPERTIDDGRVVTLPGVPGGPPQGGQQPQGSQQAPAQPQQSPLPPEPAFGPSSLDLSQGAPPQGGPQVTDLPPGRTEQREAAQAESERRAAAEGQASVSAFTLRDAREIQERIPKLSDIALARKALASVPGTEEYAANAFIESMRGTIGIEQLLNIKRQGSGLGQVPQSQLNMLADLMGRLDIGLPKEDLQMLIGDIQNRYQEVISSMSPEDRAMVGLADRELRSLSGEGQAAPPPADSGGIKFLGFE